MSQDIIRPSDFKNPPGIHQVQRMIYRGEGSPIGQKISPNIGSIYVDYLGGNIWSCTIANDSTGWAPFYSQIQSGITIDTDVQEGDWIGIYGMGAWANASASVNTARDSVISNGSENSAWMAGGKTAVAALSSTELFNGTSWFMSASSLLTAPLIPGTGELYNSNGGGSQTAAWVYGGRIFGGAAAYSFFQTFNGDTWTLGLSGNFESSSGASGGTLYSAWHTQGTDSTLAVTNLRTEYFNGSVWVDLGFTVNVLAANKGLGTSNSNIITGGANSLTAANSFTNTYFYNGVSYLASTNLNGKRAEHQISGSTLNAIISGGSDGIGAGATYLSTSEFYNGCTWGIGSNMALGERAKGGNCGGRNIAISAAGTSNGTTKLNTTEMHTQSIYRKLNFTDAMGAMDIGIAYNTQLSSYSAMVMAGDIITHRIPYRKFIGLNRYLHYPSTYFLESTRNITSITSNGDGTATVILGTGNTEITKGMILYISNSSFSSNNGKFPITNFSGGTSVTIKNPNAVNQGAVGNAALVWGNRIIGLPTTAITYTAPNLIFSFDLTGTITANSLAKLISLNSLIYVPFSSISGTNGSQYNFGTYTVKGINSNTLICSAIKTIHISESIICNSIEILNHTISSDTAEAEDFILGFNGRMNLITNKSSDANFEKW